MKHRRLARHPLSPHASAIPPALASIFATLFPVLLVATPAAAECIAYEQHMRWLSEGDPEPSAYGLVEGHDDLLLVTTGGLGYGLHVIDGASGYPIGGVGTEGEITAMAASGNHAFITEYSRLDVVRLRPSPVVVVGQVTLPGLALDAAASGYHAVVTCFQNQLVVVDVSNPSAPRVVSVTPTPDVGRAIAVEGDVAVVAGNTSLLVYDVAASPPALLGSLSGPLSRTNDVAVSSAHAFVTGEGAAPGQLAIVDISDPRAPALLGTPLGGQGNAVVVRGTQVYIGSTAGFLSIDASVLSAPVRVGRMGGGVLDATVVGTRGYAVFDGLLRMIDLTVPTSPAPVGGLVLPGRANAVVTRGPFAFVAGGEAGFHVADISNPASPVLIATRDTPGNASDIALAGDHAFIADGTGGMQVFDVTQSGSPVHVAVLATPYPAGDIAAEGPVACLAMGYRGLVVADVSDPASPFIAATVADRAWDVAIEGTLAAVGSGDIEEPGCLLLDVSNPSNPILLTAGGHPGGYGVHLDRSRLYLSWTDAYYWGFEANLDIYDVSNPRSPAWLGGRRLPADGGGVAAVSAEGHAYVEGGGLGLYVLDVSAPGTPRFIGSASAPSDVVLGASPAGDLVVTAAGRDGIQIFPVQRSVASAPSTPLLAASRIGLRVAGPQPVSGCATLRLELPAATSVRLTVYDICGRRVRRLLEAPVAGGSHTVSWDGRDDRAGRVARGVYFLRLTTPEEEATARIVWGR